jgi:glutaminyl-tRNA synthetase
MNHRQPSPAARYSEGEPLPASMSPAAFDAQGAAAAPDRQGATPALAGAAAAPTTNFIREIVEADLKSGRHGGRVITRFPPEPNGYPHIGHVKAITINFGTARDYGGRCHLRFDDTNPETEEVEYVEAIQRDIRWLGFDWGEHLYFASDYFERLYAFAEELIVSGKAYVDSLSEQALREYRGTITEAGRPSPYRERSVRDNLDLFARMRKGEFAEGEHVLRAKIDMASPNMKMRDPAIYRIRHAAHYRTGTAWHVYPLYDFAHCLSDAIEGITHSLCSLEFENNRELYDWFIDNLAVPSQPHQYEFARLAVTYTITSKRKLRQLVETGLVKGWDDPRMPTISGLRRRGYSPQALRNFMERTGVSRNPGTVEMDLLEFCAREELSQHARRVLCVQEPLRVVIENYPEGQTEQFDAADFPPDSALQGSRKLSFGRVLYVERSDFADPAPKQWHRLAPGAEVRLRYAYLIRCERVILDDSGKLVELRCTYDPASRGGTTPDGRRVKGTIHWVSEQAAIACELRLYDRLFSDPEPDQGKDGVDFKSFLNADSLQVVHALIEPSVLGSATGTQFQFERQGFFAVDPDSTAERLVFNRTVSLRDSWAKIAAHAAPAAAAPAAGRLGTSAPASSAERGVAAEHKRDAPKEPSPQSHGIRTEQSQAAQAFEAEFGVSAEQARLLTADPALTAFFREAHAVHPAPKALSNWITTELLRELKERSITELGFSGAALGELLALLDSQKISTTAAKDVFAEMLVSGRAPSSIVAERGLGRLGDDADLRPVISAVLAERPDYVAKYKAGQLGLLGALVGQVMRKTGGRADAQRVNELLKQLLSS